VKRAPVSAAPENVRGRDDLKFKSVTSFIFLFYCMILLTFLDHAGGKIFAVRKQSLSPWS